MMVGGQLGLGGACRWGSRAIRAGGLVVRGIGGSSVCRGGFEG
uniref:Uncharacterized protein n=1 Tax=Arundo donax TaxID=35708 RepID=A0A0A8Z1U3_ARUDO